MSAGVREIAYVGETPWHNMGKRLKPGSTREQWVKGAGMDWEVVRVPMTYEVGGKEFTVGVREVLVRSDEPGTVLGVVGTGYKPVQPKQVVDFFFDATEGTDFEIETMGTLLDGKRMWGLARLKNQKIVLGKNDIIKPYALLATSCDGYSATFAAFTTVRVVCCNTLDAANHETSQTGRVRVSHSVAFDSDEVRTMLLESGGAFVQFKKEATKLVKRGVSNAEAVQFFVDLLDKKDSEKLNVKDSSTFGKKMRTMMELYKNGPGADLDSAKGTAWGLVNAVTRYADFEAKADSADNRLAAAWFGAGAKLKEKAMANAMAMAA